MPPHWACSPLRATPPAPLQLTLGLDLSQANADGTHGLPMPTVVIVDGAGIIRWIDVHPNYTTRTEVADIVDALTRPRLT